MGTSFGLVIYNEQIAGEKARKVDRVLDVRQGALCWVTGTIYMDLPLKPNILDDVAKDVSWQDHDYCRNNGLIECEELRRRTSTPKNISRSLEPRQDTSDVRR